jgi:hypothetical protein
MAVGSIDIFKIPQLQGAAKFESHSAIGPLIVMEFPNVTFTPANNAIGVISDDWGQMQITAEVLADVDGSFGTITHPDTSIVSPNTGLYYIGKGFVSIKINPATTYRDIGNAPVFEFQPNLTFKDHFSSREGINKRDMHVIDRAQATLNITMEEWSYDNLLVAFLGAVGT